MYSRKTSHPTAGQAIWSKGAASVFFNQVFDELDLNDTVTHAVNIVELAFRQFAQESELVLLIDTLIPRRVINKYLSNPA